MSKGPEIGQGNRGREFWVSGRAADPGGHASWFFGLTAVGEEQIGFAGCTTSAIIDVFRRNARSLQLAAIGLRQVEHLLSPRRFPFGKQMRETVGHIFPDFVTTGANAGSDSGIEIGRSGAKGIYQAAHRALRYSGGSSPPTGMNGSYSAMNGIDQQNRHTIGGADTDAAMQFIGNKRVPLMAAIR